MQKKWGQMVGMEKCQLPTRPGGCDAGEENTIWTLKKKAMQKIKKKHKYNKRHKNIRLFQEFPQET